MSLIAEIVGPPGAGKTTIIRALQERTEAVHLNLGSRGLRYKTLWIGNAFRLLPTFLQQSWKSQRLPRRAFEKMMYLESVPRLLRRKSFACGKTTIFDQGPVYKLTRLYGFDFGSLKSKRFETWWMHVLERWAAILDVVIQLDAPDEILIERIQSREKWHRVKEKAVAEAEAYVTRYRMSYDQTLGKLTSQDGPKLLRFDTCQYPPDHIIDEILAVLHIERSRSINL